MKKVLLFLCAALLSLVASATEYDVVVSDANLYPKVDYGCDVDITSSFNGKLL